MPNGEGHIFIINFNRHLAMVHTDRGQCDIPRLGTVRHDGSLASPSVTSLCWEHSASPPGGVLEQRMALLQWPWGLWDPGRVSCLILSQTNFPLSPGEGTSDRWPRGHLIVPDLQMRLEKLGRWPGHVQ